MRWPRGHDPPDKRGAGVPRPNRDPVLTSLSVPDAEHFVQLARDVFHHAGILCNYDGQGCLVTERGRYSLIELGRLAAGSPKATWPGMLTRQMAGMVAADKVPPPTSLEEAAPLLLPKLRAVQDLPHPAPAYAPEVLPGIRLVLVLRYPSHVTELLADDAIDAFGSWAAVRSVALANMRRLPPPTISDVSADGDRPDATVHILQYDDSFGASRVLVLAELLAEIGVERPTHGVLFAVPNRHTLMVHVLRGEGVVAVLRMLVDLVRAENASQPAPVSPHLYYWVDGQSAEQVSTIDDDGSSCVLMTASLAEDLVALGLL